MLTGVGAHLSAQEVTTKATPARSDRLAQVGQLPEDPGLSVDGAERYPAATVIADEDGTTESPTIDSDTQSMAGNKFVLDGNVVLKYRERTVQADHVEYDRETGDLTANGHLLLVGGKNQERIAASHGTLNLKTQTGRLYDVTGSVGLKTTGRRTVYVSGNPFLFSGRMVVKTGPESYDVYDGTVTSCALAHPDWLLSAGRFDVDGGIARAHNSVFRLLNVPLLYLPYVTHPLDAEDRQSGVLIPQLGQSSSKGFILGEQLYFVINRSADVTVGAEYFSLRGWSQMANFRYRGLGNNFLTGRYTGLLDRRTAAQGNQGGEDATVSARRDLTPNTRLVAEVEYLSSYVYREAFAETFNQAVSSDVVSIVYAMHERNGYDVGFRADRYQGLKLVPTPTQVGQQVRIFHAPSLDVSSTDHNLGAGFEWSMNASAAGLKRVQPNFATAGIVERVDVHPEIARPLELDGWRLRPAFAVRETAYTRSRVTPYVSAGPVESLLGLNRADLEVSVEMRPPVVERTFTSGWVRSLLRSDVRHTIEPEFKYRYVTGVGSFLNVLRFDTTDVVSNTNEMEYGATQRVFLAGSRKKGGCAAGEGGGFGGGQAEAVSVVEEKEAGRCSNRELISWKLAQKYFFDPRFGGAVVTGRRNILESTLSLSGVAFLTEPRNISPLVSRLRVRTSEKTDVEWNFDYDTGARKFTSNNVFADMHQGNTFAALSYARLNAPGRFYTEGVSSLVSDFSQMRLLLGYGRPTKSGLSVATNAGLDLNLGTVQYGAVQATYNWNCCGFSAEYRKFELGSVRNENVYRFNFTLANVGTAGNLRRAERLF